MKNLAELQSECAALGIKVEAMGRASKEPYIAALRDFHWRRDHPKEPLPPQVMAMLLGSWEDLDEDQVAEIEADGSGWLVQQKMDGVRALLHVEPSGVRITSRTVSEVTYRLSELQENVPHLAEGFESLTGTILDGELICPTAAVETGATRTENALQAAMAVLATTAANARRIQADYKAHLVFHAFDVLKFRGDDTTQVPLIDRLDLLHQAVRYTQNPRVVEMPGCVIGKTNIHQRLLAAGAEGSVWKRLDGHYQPGQRARHWLKRKRALSMAAFVSNFKPGTADHGNSELIGALEFSCEGADGTVAPVGWISNLTSSDREAMTTLGVDGGIRLKPEYLRKKAIITGQDLSARSRRLRHARLVRWLDA